MIIKNSFYKLTAVDLKDLPKEGLPEVAFAGRSNVGKSSFINSISNNNHLARVSKTPGKTITLNYYLINNEFYFVDMPGYGYAKRGMESLEFFNTKTDIYLKERKELKLVLLLVDSRQLTEDDKLMNNYLKSNNINYLVIGTKLDKLKRNEIKPRFSAIVKELEITDDKLLLYSSLTKEGKDAILSKFDELIN